MHLRNVPQSGSVDPFTGDPSFELVTVQTVLFFLVLCPAAVVVFPRSPCLGPKSSSAATCTNEPTIAKTSQHVFSTILQESCCHWLRTLTLGYE